MAFNAGPLPTGLGQDVAHLLRSNKGRQDVVVTGVMRTQQFDHGSNRFTIDAIERAPRLGNRSIIRRPPRTLLKQEAQRIERLPKPRHWNGAVPIGQVR